MPVSPMPVSTAPAWAAPRRGDRERVRRSVPRTPAPGRAARAEPTGRARPELAVLDEGDGPVGGRAGAGGAEGVGGEAGAVGVAGLGGAGALGVAEAAVGVLDRAQPRRCLAHGGRDRRRPGHGEQRHDRDGGAVDVGAEGARIGGPRRIGDAEPSVRALHPQHPVEGLGRGAPWGGIERHDRPRLGEGLAVAGVGQAAGAELADARALGAQVRPELGLEVDAAVGRAPTRDPQPVERLGGAAGDPVARCAPDVGAGGRPHPVEQPVHRRALVPGGHQGDHVVPGEADVDALAAVEAGDVALGVGSQPPHRGLQPVGRVPGRHRLGGRGPVGAHRGQDGEADRHDDGHRGDEGAPGRVRGGIGGASGAVAHGPVPLGRSGSGLVPGGGPARRGGGARRRRYRRLRGPAKQIRPSRPRRFQR